MSINSREVIELLDILVAKFPPQSLAGSFYRTIRQMYALPPLSALDFQANLDDLDFDNDALQELFVESRKAFRVYDETGERLPLEQIEQALGNLLTTINIKHGWANLVAARLVRISAQKWLSSLRLIQNDPIPSVQISLSILPLAESNDPLHTHLSDMEQDIMSESTKDDCDSTQYPFATHIPLLIYYVGQQPSIIVSYNLKTDGSVCVASNMNIMPTTLISGKVYIQALKVRTGFVESQITIELESNQSVRPIKPLIVTIPTGNKDIPEKRIENYLINPYSPGRPLSSGEEQGMIKGEATRILRNILPDRHVPRQLHLIRGIKRTGKTTVLLGLNRSIKLRQIGIPVYIDLYAWHLSLVDQDIIMTPEKVWYELATKAILAAELAIELNEYKIHPKTIRRWRSYLFSEEVVKEKQFEVEDATHPLKEEHLFDRVKRFIYGFYKETKKPFIFLLDELPWLYLSKYDKQVSYHLLYALNSFTRINEKIFDVDDDRDLKLKGVSEKKQNSVDLDYPPCAIVATHGWSDLIFTQWEELWDNPYFASWEEWYAKLNIGAIVHRTHFLNEQEVRYLARMPIKLGRQSLDRYSDLVGDRVNQERLTSDQYEQSVAFTDIALTYIWQVTGGWPGLVHLLLYIIVEDLNRKNPRNEDRFLVALRDVRSAVIKLVQVTYLPEIHRMLDSFDSDEQIVLKKFPLYLEPASLHLSGIQKTPEGFLIDFHILQEFRKTDLSESVLQRTFYLLLEKQIIEPVSPPYGKLRLRVGLFIYPQIWLTYNVED